MKQNNKIVKMAGRQKDDQKHAQIKDKSHIPDHHSDERPEWSKLSASAPSLFNKTKSDMITYEDLLVHQYLEKIKREKKDNIQEKHILQSPYLQRLPHTHLVSRRYRPMSATVHGSYPASGKPKIDAKYIADSSLWDPSTPRQAHSKRPASAPVRRLRPQSAASLRARGSKVLFRKQPHVIKVNAFINGSRSRSVYLAAPNIKILLENATEKLGLPFAARRIFTEDGAEILSESDIPSEGDIYISMGEMFKDPFYATKQNVFIRNNAAWNLKGVILPENVHKRRTKMHLSRRMRALCENKKVRILVYRNGHSSDACEVVANLKNIQDFLNCCTIKLDLHSCAKIAYDLDGNEISDLADMSVLDESILHQGKTPLLGPLWISTGEGFSPSGTQSFLVNMKNSLKNKLQMAKQHKQNIDFALNNEKEKVTDVAVLSMSTEELYEASERADNEVERYKESLAHIKKKLRSLQEDVSKEEKEGLKYRMSHIQELSADNRLVGTRGCRLKVFENGKAQGAFTYYFNIREALRGIDSNNSREKLMQKLLDELSNTRFSAGANRNMVSVATKLYDQNGCEITDVLTLEQEQARQIEKNIEQPEIPVWLSFGEPYISPVTYALHLFLDKATVHNEQGEGKIVKETVTPEEEPLVRDSSKWQAVTELPDSHVTAAYSGSTSHFLQHKVVHNFLLYPEIGVAEKLACRNQLFVYSETGYMYCKAAPQLCLTASDTRVEATLLGKELLLSGFVVCMQKKSLGMPGQIWRCTPDASMYSEAYPNLLLTYLGHKREADECNASMNNGISGPSGDVSTAFLIVADPLPKKHKSAQRFAFKQENFHNLGQWKKTDHSNPEWNKLAYSWPVRADGELNKEYDWPMEGFIIPYAPPLQRPGSKLGIFGMTPVRLRVLKNFEPNVDLAVSVVGPNLINQMVNNNFRKKSASKQHRRKKHVTSIDNFEESDFNSKARALADLEFQMFLQTCTGLLNLSLAARRLFDSQGRELFTIQNLERDTLVYVSCGEAWAGTNVSRVEQKRRFLMNQLSADVAKIQQYCSLRNPENFVLEVNGPLAPNSGLTVNKLWSPENGPQHETREGSEAKDSSDQSLSQNLKDENSWSHQDSAHLTAHQRAHKGSEERLNSLKWPWERLVNVSNSMDMDDPEANKYTDRDLYEKFKPQIANRTSRDMFQKFEYANEYISLVADENLVLSVSETEGRVASVILAKKRPDDINQRWIIRENGEIQARHKQNMVLTVIMPATTSDDHACVSFAGCPVVIQARCSNAFGGAHQMWFYDGETGVIRAFHSDPHDKEITAANKADVCTYAITQGADVDQPGYLVEMNGQQHHVCMSCARALRGRYEVQRLPPNTTFHCAMGDAKQLKIQQAGSFKILNNKVDLSTFEADISLQYWSDMLRKLKQQTSIQTIMRDISAARTVLTVKVMAYKNGEGRLRKGELICGSSIAGILAHCTYRLGLNSAARRMYLEDGSVVLDVDDLVKFATENCKTEMINSILLSKGEHVSEPEDKADVNVETDARLQNLHIAASKDVSEVVERSFDNMATEDINHEMVKDENINKEEHSLDTGTELSKAKDQAMKEHKNKVEREKLLENIKLPSLEVILRAPIEVWVSSGKAFVAPEAVESKEENFQKKRQFRAQVCQALEIEKHILRQLKGRRLEQKKPAVYRSTLSSQQPVVIEQQWQEPTVEEQDKHLSIEKLQTHLGEIRANQQEGTVVFKGLNLQGKLYGQPSMKRVLVFPNGMSADKSVYVWGSTIQEILDSACLKLNLWKRPCILYSMDGRKTEAFEDIQRDQLLCISTGKPFTPASNQRMQTEVKANWGRARRQYGKHATDLVLDVKKSPHVDVDPFGPPLLALPEVSPQNIQ